MSRRAADHRGDDRLELLLGAAQRVGRAGDSTWIAAKSVAAQRGEDEQHDLDARHRHADIARRVGVAAAAKIQLPNRVRSSTQVQNSVRPIHQTIDTGMPATSGSPSARLAISPRSDSQPDESGQPTVPENSGSSEIVGGQRMHARDLGPPGDAARHAERQAAQHEQAAERDDEGRQAGAHDDHAVERSRRRRTRRRRR